MPGNGNADVLAALLPDLIGDLIGNRRIRIVLHLLLIFFLGELRVFFGDRALRHGHDREPGSSRLTLIDRFDHFVDIIRNLRNENDIRTACHTGIQCQPSYLMSHHFHDKDTRMGRCRGMYAVDTVCRDIHRALEAECHVRAPQIVVDGLRKRDHIKSFFAQQIGGLMGSVAAQDHHAVQLQFIIVLLHGFHFVEAVLIRLAHQLKRCPGASEDRAAFRQDTRKIMSCQHTEIPVDQSLIAIEKTIDLNILSAAGQTLHHAAHRRVQCLTVPAAGQHTNSFHSRILLHIFAFLCFCFTFLIIVHFYFLHNRFLCFLSI